MTHRRLVVLAISVLALGAVTAQNAAAQGVPPSPPSTFFGAASIDGKPVPDGTEVRGFIDGKDCTQTAQGFRGTVTDGGASAYVVTIVHESQIAGCGRAGRTVTFRIAGHAAGQSSPWQPGAQRLDINSGGGSPVPLPTATPTSRAAPSIPTKASGETVSGQSVSSASTGNPTPLAGTPPVDNINIPFVPTPSVQRSPVESVGVNEGERSIWIVLGPLIALAVAAGIGGGIYLSRRKAAGS